MTIFFKKYNGLNYIYFDARNKTDLQLFEGAIQLNKYIEAAENHSVRIIVDVSQLNLSFKAYFSIREVARKVQPKILFSAFVGMTKHTEVVFRLYKRFTKTKVKLFQTIDDALDYVTQDIKQEKKAS